MFVASSECSSPVFWSLYSKVASKSSVAVVAAGAASEGFVGVVGVAAGAMHGAVPVGFTGVGVVGVGVGGVLVGGRGGERDGDRPAVDSG